VVAQPDQCSALPLQTVWLRARTTNNNCRIVIALRIIHKRLRRRWCRRTSGRRTFRKANPSCRTRPLTLQLPLHYRPLASALRSPTINPSQGFAFPSSQERMGTGRNTLCAVNAETSASARNAATERGRSITEIAGGRSQCELRIGRAPKRELAGRPLHQGQERRQ